MSTRKPASTGSSGGGTDLTDPQRDEIDTSTALLLRNLSTSIATLSSAETLRQETSTTLLRKKHGTGLLRWARGGSPSAQGQADEEDNETEPDEAVARTTKTVRESVLWYLRHVLDEAVGVQRGLVEKRIERVREKEKSVLYKSSASVPAATVTTTTTATATTTAPPVEELSSEEIAAIEAELSPEQLQLFAQENDTMVKHYEDTLVKVQ